MTCQSVRPTISQIVCTEDQKKGAESCGFLWLFHTQASRLARLIYKYKGGGGGGEVLV